MNYQISPEAHIPAGLGVPASTPTATSVPSNTGRFAQTRRTRALRGIFAGLCRYAPTVATHLAFRLLARPPRPDVRDWHLMLLDNAQRRSLTCGANTLSVYEWGSGPPVLMVHGWGSHATHMGRMILPLVNAGYRVIAFDAPAHGLSSGRTTDLFEFARAISVVAGDAGPLHAIVAHSFGAAMALYAARDWGVDTGKMALISPFEHFNWFMDAFADQVGLSPDVMKRLRDMQAQRYGGRLDWGRMSVVDMARTANLDLLVIHDQDDKEIPVAHGHAVAEARPGTRFIETSGLGHHLVVRNAAVIKHVVDFVRVKAQPHAAP
ncbi:MAG TPA: alpha/beta hydrolase [Burkholderiaceae bacterium]